MVDYWVLKFDMIKIINWAFCGINFNTSKPQRTFHLIKDDQVLIVWRTCFGKFRHRVRPFRQRRRLGTI